MVAVLSGLDPTTLLIIVLGTIGYVVKTWLEASGRVRSNKVLREENADLAERKKTLENERAALVAKEVILVARIEALELKVRELESHDQAAVLKALHDHETGAIERAETTHGLQRETSGWLERIATSLETTNGGT